MDGFKVAINIDCKPGSFQQINQISHWLDGSNIYGSSLEESKKLRTFQDGLLNSQISPDGSELLPEGESEECTGERCFKAGNFKLKYIIFARVGTGPCYYHLNEICASVIKSTHVKI